MNAVAVIIAAALVAALGIVGSMDAADEAAAERHYCEMVELWKRDAAAGIPAIDRAGWPNYRQLECR